MDDAIVATKTGQEEIGSRVVLAFVVNATASDQYQLHAQATLAQLQPHSRRAHDTHTRAIARAVDARAVARG